MSNLDVILEWVNLTWGKQDLSQNARLMTPDATLRGIVTGETITTAELPEFVMTFCSLVGPIWVEIEHSIEQGNWVATRMRMHTHDLKDKKPFSCVDHMMIRMENGRIAEVISHLDYITLLEHCGQVPPDTLMTCLTGNRLDWVS